MSNTPLHYLIYRTKADNIICYITMSFLAFIGVAGITATISDAGCDKYECYRRQESISKREEEETEEEEDPLAVYRGPKPTRNVTELKREWALAGLSY